MRGPNAEPDDGSPRRKVGELVTSSGLPDAARELILRIVKRTRLTRREKAGVAIELIAHFGDGIDASASIDDLIAGFGDEITTAKLIRRAKLRCRSGLSRTIRGLSQASAVLIVFYVGAIAYYTMGSPNVAVDYMAKSNEAVLTVPEAERAWPAYRVALLDLDRERAGKVLKMKRLYPTGESWDEVVKLLKDSQPTIITSRRASAMPHLGYVKSSGINEDDRELWPEQYEAAKRSAEQGHQDPYTAGVVSPDTFLLFLQLPHIGELRRLAALLQLDAIHAAEQGDGDRVSADLAALLGMARQLHATPTLKVVATDIAMKAVGTTGAVLSYFRDVLSDEHLQQLAHGLAAEDVVPPMSVEEDRIGFYDIIQRIYTDDGHGDGHLTSGWVQMGSILAGITGSSPRLDIGRWTGTAFAPVANFVSASRKEMTAQYEQSMDRYEAMSRQPLWERRSDDPIETWNLMSDEQKLGDRYWLVANMVPGLDDMYRTHQNAVGQRDGVLIAVALELHRRRNGSYPESLDELSPDLLPSVPRDRFTGETMRYQLKDDQVAVYSVGRDLDDDGGVLTSVAQATLPAIEGEKSYQREERLRHNRILESDSWIERRPHLNKVVSPNPRVVVSGTKLKEGTGPPDGDWGLWYSAEWPVERDAAKSELTDIWTAAAKGDKATIEQQFPVTANSLYL